MISKYISLPIFVFSFIIGIIFVYFMGPDKKTILIFPNPENYLNIQYKDSANQCFQFTPQQVKCPANPLAIKSIPIQ